MTDKPIKQIYNNFEFLEHMADIKIRIHAQTLQKVFELTVEAVAKYSSGEQKVQAVKGKVIDVKGEDIPSLLYHFIDDLLYLIDAEHFIPAKADVTLRGNNLHAELFGDDTTKYELEHIKAATYADMQIGKVKRGKQEYWEAVFVLDV